MVKLPNGKDIGLFTGHILEPGQRWFPCPDGHFWHQVPDLAINRPPFQRGQTLICDFVHSPCPADTEEAKRFVRVVEVHDERTFSWQGLMLHEADRPDGWSEEDRRAWQAWLATPSVHDFLERVVRVCREQAMANRECSGPPAFCAVERRESPCLQETRRRAAAIAREAVALEPAADAARARRDEQEGLRIFERLLELEEEVTRMLVDPRRDCIEGWLAKGALCRLLLRREEAERSFVEATRRAPFALDAWLGLTRVRGESGKLDAAEQAARRAVDIEVDSPQAWANLGAVLMQAGRTGEAQAAVDRALALDPTDRVARNVRVLLRGRARRTPKD